MGIFWKYMCCLCVLYYSVAISRGHSIVKRNAVQLCNLVNLHTARSCLSYNPYGCFCGYGQQWAQPTDQADRCCKEHDDCYGSVNDGNFCYFWSGLFVGYGYTCEGTTCSCTDNSKCSRKVCECDLKLAKCLGKAEYNQQYKNYDRSKCKHVG